MIIPVYNEERQLEAVIRNFMKISFQIPTEWIFVDDCSKDNSVSILKKTFYRVSN
ncbi:MAG: glycosyltransferase [Xanthomonadaceae bacterium]|nr:glycosyltransferase [Xanthomonadaceae bacterium]